MLRSTTCAYVFTVTKITNYNHRWTAENLYFSSHSLGEDSRAPSDRTMSEYMIANERATASTLTTPSRKHRTNNRRSRSQERPPRAHSAASHHSARHYDENSDIYVTTAAYRPPSEIRYLQITRRKTASFYVISY